MAVSTPAPARTTFTAKRAAASSSAEAQSPSGRPRRAAHDRNPFSNGNATPLKARKLPPPTKEKAPPADSLPPQPRLRDAGSALDEAAQGDGESSKATDRSAAEPKLEADDAEEDDRCPACDSVGKGDEGTWVECDMCEKWYHWSCVAGSSSESPDNIDKWYCSSCVAASASSSEPLKTTYKVSPLSSIGSSRAASPTATAAPPLASTSASAPSPSFSSHAPTSKTPANPNLRKSSRSTRAQNIDYANLDQHLPASVDRWIKTISAREALGQIVDGFVPAPTGGGFRRFADGNELAKEGDEWVYGELGMTEPFVIDREEGLGLQMPPRLTVKEVAELVGPKTPLEVIDCASQSSLSNWTLGQWASYYEDPKREKVRNVISLEVSDSRLGEMVKAPELVRKLDWVDTVWPDDMKVPGQYPRVQKYCLMSVEKCWTDWHVDFAGSSVFYHVLRGGKTFFFIRPTPANLQAYEQWSGSSERQEQTWLGDMVDKVYRMDLKEGNTAFIPTGWIHAVYTPADSLVIGGNFLHSLNIPTQLRVYNIELATKVPRKFRYPHFVKLLWLVGKHYHERLSSHPAGEPLPLSLRAPRVLDGLKELSSFLIEQTTRLAKGAQVSAERRRLARENIPAKKIPDPVALSRDFRKAVLRARGEPFDAACFLPHVAYVDEPADSPVGTKRKADGLELDANAALAALSRANKLRRPSSSGPAPPNAYAAVASGDGEIIGRQNFPVQKVTRTEERIDPRGSAQNGATQAEVRESRSTQCVVRRWEHDPAGASAGAGAGAGGPVVETRTVITIIERVRFPTAEQAKAHAEQQRGLQAYRSPYPAAQPVPAPGIGPHAPQSVTAVPGTPPQPIGATNPQPYQPYGWPYQYQLPAAGAAAAAGASALPAWGVPGQGAPAGLAQAPLSAPVGAALPPLPTPPAPHAHSPPKLAPVGSMPPPPLPLPRVSQRPSSANGLSVPPPEGPSSAVPYPPPRALAPATVQGGQQYTTAGLPHILPAPSAA